MKVLVYEVEVSSDVMSFVHGFSQKIKEVYFPEGHLFLNGEACFHTNQVEAQNRLKGAIGLEEREIDIDTKVVEKIVSILEDQEKTKLTLETARQGLLEWIKKNDSKCAPMV